MRGRLRTAAGLVALTMLSLSSLVSAQASGGQDVQPGTNPGGSVTHPLQIALRGCLKHATNDDGYYIADDNGRTWRLVANGVNLAEHVNQRVMLTGRPDSGPQQQTEGAVKEPQLSMRVLTVKTLSPSCGE